MTAGVPLVAMRGITKRFGPVTACDGVDLRVAAGEGSNRSIATDSFPALAEVTRYGTASPPSFAASAAIE